MGRGTRMAAHFAVVNGHGDRGDERNGRITQLEAGS